MKYDFLDTDVLTRLGALPLEARQAMIGNVAGRHRSPFRGSSVEFAEYRKYVQGDDTRRLDWKAYARSDRYYIKEFEADTNLRAYMLVDSSGSMAFGSEPPEGETPPPKIQYARSLAATLAYLAVDQGDASALMCCGEAMLIDIPPSRRPAHLQHIFETLSSLEPKGATGLVDGIHTIAERAGTRAFIAVISDCFVEPDELADALQHLRYRKHDVVVFQLMDPQELRFDFQRPHRFVDMEDGTSIVAEPTIVAEDYLKALQSHLDDVASACHDAGVDHILVDTSVPYDQVLEQFLTSRLK